MVKFIVCDHCGNIAGLIKDNGPPVSCCGQKMTHLQPNTVEASQEKHLPDVTKTAGGLSVKVGSISHPMDADHYIDFIYVKTQKGGHRAQLNVGDAPAAEFCFAADDNPVAVYAYCNLHGLWKVEL